MTIWLGLGMSIVLRLIKCDKKCDKEWHMQANDGCKDFTRHKWSTPEINIHNFLFKLSFLNLKKIQPEK